MRLLVNIDVPEIEPAVAFYGAALGLALKRMVSADVAELAGAASTIYLLRHDADSSSTSDNGAVSRRYERHWTPVHLDFVVEDVEQAAARAQAAGAVRESDCVCWNGSRCITFADPFGHGFCLIAFDDGKGYQGNED